MPATSDPTKWVADRPVELTRPRQRERYRPPGLPAAGRAPSLLIARRYVFARGGVPASKPASFSFSRHRADVAPGARRWVNTTLPGLAHDHVPPCAVSRRSQRGRAPNSVGTGLPPAPRRTSFRPSFGKIRRPPRRGLARAFTARGLPDGPPQAPVKVPVSRASEGNVTRPIFATFPLSLRGSWRGSTLTSLFRPS